MKSLRLILALIFVSNVALADRKQNDNIDMNGNQIKNADIDGGTASNTSRITAPKNTKSNLDALTRKEGTVVYGTDTGKLYVDNGSLLTPVGSGEGSAGLNAILNPNAATDVTGYSYVGSGTGLARHTTAADLPLYPTVTTGLAITPDMTNDYVAYCGQMPAALKNRKLRFSQFQKPGSGFASGDLKLEIYPSTSSTCATVGTKYTLNKDSSGVTSIPNATQDFWTTFDADSSDYFQVRWVRVTGTALFVVQNVYIGAGDQPTGPPISDWQSYTPSFGAGWGTVTGIDFKYRRVGDTIQIRGKGTSGTVSGASSSISLPSGLSVPTSVQNSIIGISTTAASATLATQNSALLFVPSGVSTSFSLTNVGDGATAKNLSALNVNQVIANSTAFSISAEIPIAEWADSSNVVNYGQQDVEYVYNSSTTTSDDTSSFAYGPLGAAFQSFAETGTNFIAKRVRFQSPVQIGDLVLVETSIDSGLTWAPLGQNSGVTAVSLDTSGTTIYGVSYAKHSATDFDVRFFSKANAGQAWSSYTGGQYRWRVKKISGNALGGFQYATANAAGLVSREASGTATGSFTGARSFSMDFSWARVGKTVTIYWPGNSSSACGSASTFAATGVLPAEARPAADVNAVVIVQDSGAIQADPGRMIINWSTGNITIFKSLTLSNFTGSGNCGIYAGSVSYVAGS